MNILNSLAAICLILAVAVAPQLLAMYFSVPRNSESA